MLQVREKDTQLDGLSRCICNPAVASEQGYEPSKAYLQQYSHVLWFEPPRRIDML